ncbi:hypothetical protein I4U23_018880 [Adineta vaga]|nr:hypothetical protein I4U23_018880 [Adineta vaga]
MSIRASHPLIFSIDNYLLEEHLVQLDLSSKHLKRIDQISNQIDFNVILLDHNEISKVENLDRFSQLTQLSLSHNRLIDIHLLHRIRSVQKLNLSYNLIDSIDSLKTLQNLVMLNISNNNIPSIGILNNCCTLQSLDASENCIQQIEDLSQLTSLKYLNLHKNFLDTLNLISRYWPKSLHTLIISDNEIQDLTEIAHLSSFITLNTLYFIDNPCLSIVDEKHGCHQPFDYRPYILNWCVSLHNLDGLFITRKESLKAEWLLSQGKGRSFGFGEHAELVQYLIRVCSTDTHEKDDLNLSRIMQQQNLYIHQRQNEHTNEEMEATSDTIHDATDTLSQNTHRKLHQSTLISESEFILLNTSSSTTSADEEPVSSTRHHQMHTPSQAYSRSIHTSVSHIDDPITENSSSNRYAQYDDRPIKPLDQNMLQAKLNQYPFNNFQKDNINRSRSQIQAHAQAIKPSPSSLGYNANRYSPKTASSEPTHSSILSEQTNVTLTKLSHNRQKLRRRNTIHSNLLQPYDNVKHYSTTNNRNQIKERQVLIDTSNDNRNQHVDDDMELHSKSVPTTTMLSARSTTMNNTSDIDKLTTSVETMRTSILHAYMDLHERFTKTTELQTSAISALWKKCETQNLTHQHETEKITQQNRLLNQRIHELEERLKTTNESHSATHTISKHNPHIHPPLRAHISKRDAKSFFLHWIPNSLNESQRILGYRIYIDDVFKGAIDSGKFEAIIDYIRDEGEYKIKIRTYNQDGESSDSNIVIARFRRQHSTMPASEVTTSRRRTQSERIAEDINEKQTNEDLIMLSRNRSRTPIIMDKRRSDIEQPQDLLSITPEKETILTDQPSDSSTKTSPHMTRKDYAVMGKPPISPTSSPNRTERKSPNREFCGLSTKRSPVRAGIMSRLTKSSNKLKQNSNLLNVPPIERSNSPTESINISKNEMMSVKRTITFQPDLNSNEHESIVSQQIPIRSTFDPTTSIDVDHFTTRSSTFLSTSPSSPPSRRSTKFVPTSSLDQ